MTVRRPPQLQRPLNILLRGDRVLASRWVPWARGKLHTLERFHVGFSGKSFGTMAYPVRQGITVIVKVAKDQKWIIITADAGSIYGFLYIPRVGEITTSGVGAVPKMESDGWQPPYFDGEGNEIREDGVNLGTVAPALDRFVPAETDDDQTTRLLTRKRGKKERGAWKMERNPPDNFGNLDWRDQEGHEVLNWLGPMNRYWNWYTDLGDSPETSHWYLPQIYRKGALYATAPEDVIGCAVQVDAVTDRKILVAATTQIYSANVGFTSFVGSGTAFDDFSTGQVDETNIYCRFPGDTTEDEVFDQTTFDDLVMQYETASTQGERDTLRSQIEDHANRWYDTELRGHADLIDTSVPEMQSTAHPQRRISTDIWPFHFNASGNEGQTLRRQSAYSEAMLSNGEDISADVRYYRYERIKVGVTFTVDTVTVAEGTEHEFDVDILDLTITPTRITGDRLPRLDILPETNVVDTSEPTPSVDNTLYNYLDVDNTISINGARSGSLVIAADYIGDTEVLGYMDLDETIAATGSADALFVRRYKDGLPDTDYEEEVSWAATFSRSTTHSFRFSNTGDTFKLSEVTVVASADSYRYQDETENVNEEGFGDGTNECVGDVDVITGKVNFIDLRKGVAAVVEEHEEVDFNQNLSVEGYDLSPGNPIEPQTDNRFAIPLGTTGNGWTFDGHPDAFSDIALEESETFQFIYYPSGVGGTEVEDIEILLQGTVDRKVTQRVFLFQGGIETVLNTTTILNQQGVSELPDVSRISFYVPPFTDESVYEVRIAENGHEVYPSDPRYAFPVGTMATSGEIDERSNGDNIPMVGSPIGNWATGQENDVMGSIIIYNGSTHETVNYITDGDLVDLNELIVPDGEYAAFFNCAYIGRP